MLCANPPRCQMQLQGVGLQCLPDTPMHMVSSCLNELVSPWVHAGGLVWRAGKAASPQHVPRTTLQSGRSKPAAGPGGSTKRSYGATPRSEPERGWIPPPRPARAGGFAEANPRTADPRKRSLWLDIALPRGAAEKTRKGERRRDEQLAPL